MPFIYLLHLFKGNPLECYKLGKTKRNFMSRFREYKHAEVLYVTYTSDCDIAEKDLLVKFREAFEGRQDMGDEYFDGDIGVMLQLLHSYFSVQKCEYPEVEYPEVEYI